MSDLKALIERVREAKGPSRETDRTLERLAYGDGVVPFTPDYTASIDAALGLVERLLPGRQVNIHCFGPLAEASLGARNFGKPHGAPTPPLAILLALLTSLSEDKPHGK